MINSLFKIKYIDTGRSPCEEKHCRSASQIKLLSYIYNSFEICLSITAQNLHIEVLKIALDHNYDLIKFFNNFYFRF